MRIWLSSWLSSFCRCTFLPTFPQPFVLTLLGIRRSSCVYKLKNKIWTETFGASKIESYTTCSLTNSSSSCLSEKMRSQISSKFFRTEQGQSFLSAAFLILASLDLVRVSNSSNDVILFKSHFDFQDIFCTTKVLFFLSFIDLRWLVFVIVTSFWFFFTVISRKIWEPEWIFMKEKSE